MNIKQTSYIQRLTAIPTSPLSEGIALCSKNSDIINLGTAENRLMNDLLKPVFEHREGISMKSISYFSNTEKQLQEALAALYQDYFDIKVAKPHQFLFGVGVSFFVEKLGLVLC